MEIKHIYRYNLKESCNWTISSDYIFGTKVLINVFKTKEILIFSEQMDFLCTLKCKKKKNVVLFAEPIVIGITPSKPWYMQNFTMV